MVVEELIKENERLTNELRLSKIRENNLVNLVISYEEKMTELTEQHTKYVKVVNEQIQTLLQANFGRLAQREDIN